MWNAISQGFELMSLCPIPAMITITLRAPVVSDMNGLLISRLRSMATQGERHNSYYANLIPYMRHISWCLRTLSVEIWKTQLHLSTVKIQLPMAKYPTPTPMVQSQLTLFQNPQILRTISSRHDVIHTPASFPVWGFIMTMVIVISFAYECKTTPNDYAPELLTRLVQSPTKLNDKI